MSDVPPDLLPLRAAERYGRLFIWATQLEISRQERAVLMHLIVVGNHNLNSTWSHASIAEKIGWSERIVWEAVKSLGRKGLIERYPRKNSNGTRTSDRVRVKAPQDLLRERTSYAEQRAAIDAELAAEAYAAAWADSGLPNRPANTAERTAVRSAHAAEEPFGLSIDQEREQKVAPQILRSSRKPRAERGHQPQRISAALSFASDVRRAVEEAG